MLARDHAAVVRRRQGRRHRRRAELRRRARRTRRKEKNGVYINSGAAPRTSPTRSALRIPCTGPTTPTCSPMPPAGTGEGRCDAWFFLTADYAFGASLERDTSAVVLANGGKVVGSKASLNTSDFSSFVLMAQSRSQNHRACNASGDTTNSVNRRPNSVSSSGQKLAAFCFAQRRQSHRLETAQA